MSPVVVLVRADLISLRNRLRRIDRRRLTIFAVCIPILAGAVLAPAVSLGVAAAPLGGSATTGAFTIGFTSLGMVMLVVGLSSVMVSFFTSRDLLLLAGAPLRLRDIYIARMLVAARASLLVAALLLAALIGYGASTGAGLAYWIATPLMVGCAVIATTALQVAMLSAIVRFVPVSRARTMVSVVAAVVGSAFWLGWLLLRSQQAIGNDVGGTLTQTAAGAADLGERLVWLPTAWPARALSGFARGDVSAPLWALTTLIFTAVLAMLGHALFVQSFRRGLSALGEVPRRTAAAQRAARSRLDGATAHPEWAARPRPALLALVLKEWTVMRRDARRLAALVPLCIISALYPLIGPGSGLPSGGEAFWPSVTRTGSVSLLLPFFFTQMLAAPAVALEGRAFLLMRLAPLDVGTLLRAKVIAVAVPMSLATCVACTVLGISRGGTPPELVALLLSGVWLAMGATAIGVGGGAIGARFEAEDPRRAVSTGAALGSTVASLTFLGCSAIAGVQVAQATGTVGHRLVALGGDGRAAAMVAAFVAVAVAAAIVVFVLTLAERRLARWQPDGSRAPDIVPPPPQWGYSARR